jgi:Na+/H+-dicarboxylate symporters
MSKLKLSLLPKVIIAIFLGIICSLFFPDFLSKFFVTINGIFSNFLGFVIPLIIVGLVAPGIAELGKGAGKLLALTALIAYISTILAGFFSYFTCEITYPLILDNSNSLLETVDGGKKIVPYFTIDMPPIFGVTSALILSFLLGLGVCAISGDKLKGGLIEFRDLIIKLFKE